VSMLLSIIRQRRVAIA